MVNPYLKRSIPLLMVACFLSLLSRFPSFHEYFSIKLVFVSCYPVNPPLFRLTGAAISARLMPWDKASCMPNRVKRESGGCGKTCHDHQ
jgi:hypothetical protein